MKKQKKIWNPHPLKDDIKLYTSKRTTIAHKYYGKEKNKKTILFFYGFAGNIEYLRVIGAELGKEYSFLCVDYPGHGFSPKQEIFSLDEFIDAVISLLDFLGEKNIFLYGYSFGGIVSLMFYQKYKDKVDKLILLNSEYNFSFNFIKKIFYNIFLLVLKQSLKFAIVNLAIPVLKDKYLTRENYNDAEEVIMYNDHQSVVDLYEAIVFNDYEYLLRDINCPVLIIGSHVDFLISKGRSKNIASKIAGSELYMIKDVGHLTVATDPYPAINKSLEFLKR